MAGSVTTDFDQSVGRLVLRCDTAGFERLLATACREGGVSVPVSVPPTPVQEVSIVLAADAPPPRMAWWRHVAAVAICVLTLAGPFGIYTLVNWSLK